MKIQPRLVPAEELFLPETLSAEARKLYAFVWNKMYSQGATSIYILNCDATDAVGVDLRDLIAAQDELMSAGALGIEREQPNTIQQCTLYVFVAPSGAK